MQNIEKLKIKEIYEPIMINDHRYYLGGATR